MQNKRVNKGIEVCLQELIALRHQASYKPIAHKKWLELQGQRLSNARGRGIEFDATREYQPGDDIRNMAWRVTARSLKPHVKVYHEERERPVWLGLDLSPSLYFGTRSMFKSVCSIKEATKLGWSHLATREKIGAVICAHEKTVVFKPKASEKNFSTILNAFVTSSKSHPPFSATDYLHDLLSTLNKQVRSGNLLFILSDFLNFDTNNQKLLAHIAQRAQVVLIFVYDPLEAKSPIPHQYVITDGKQKILFDMNNAKARFVYEKQFQNKLDELTRFARKYDIQLKMIGTDQMDN